jgi:hypothetical protein
VTARILAGLAAVLARHGAQRPSNARPPWWRLLLRTGQHRQGVPASQVLGGLAGERARSAADTQQMRPVADGPEPTYAEASP